MKSILKLFSGTLSWVVQIIIIIFLTVFTQRALETIPVPGVFKSLSIIQLDDLNSSVLQNAMDLKSSFTGETGIDTNIYIINIESANPLLKRGEMATAIKFLKDNGAKTIALDIALDTPSTNLNPAWDKELAEAIKYAGNVITFNAFQIVPDTANKKMDTNIVLNPIRIFDTCLADVGFGDMYPPESIDNPGGVIQFFFPNQLFKGKMMKSFPLSVAWNYDSAKAAELAEYTSRLYINLYRKTLFTQRMWELSLISNPEVNIYFKEFVKDKLFMFGYITPDDELLRNSMFATPLGKLDYVIVYASIVSDILKQKFVPESPPQVDFALGILVCLFNLFFISYASKKTLLWEKFTGALLVFAEVFILYFLVMFIYIFFNYALSIIVLSIVCFISVPTITIIRHKILPFYDKYCMYFDQKKYPYPIIKPYMTIFEPKKRSIRHLTVVFELHRMFRLLSALSIPAVNKIQPEGKPEATDDDKFKILGNENPQTEIWKKECPQTSFPAGDIIQFKDWNELKEYNQNNSSNEINSKILSIINQMKDIDTLNVRSIDEYDKLFSVNHIRQELFLRAEEETEIQPYLDTFSRDKIIFKDLVRLLAGIFNNYKFIYVSKGEPGKYLIKSLMKVGAPAEYLKTSKSLLPKNVYLADKKNDSYILLSPYIQYRMCHSHYKRELFVFSNLQYNPGTGKAEANFIGEYFMCAPLDESLHQIIKDENNQNSE